ncbi:MAG: hypothetical protein JWM95_2331 [Gemmatimonadetes bacterium]|nr:hypothetical protein [Gemmatimonadota bacterium]
MAYIRKILLWVPGVIWATFLWAAQIAPDEAKQNLAKWAAKVGIDKWPTWLTDTRTVVAATILVALFYAWLIWRHYHPVVLSPADDGTECGTATLALGSTNVIELTAFCDTINNSYPTDAVVVITEFIDPNKVPVASVSNLLMPHVKGTKGKQSKYRAIIPSEAVRVPGIYTARIRATLNGAVRLFELACIAQFDGRPPQIQAGSAARHFRAATDGEPRERNDATVLPIYADNPLVLEVDLKYIDRADGREKPLTSGTVTAFLATSNSATAAATDPNLTVSCTTYGTQGKWLASFASGQLAFSKLDRIFGTGVQTPAPTPYLILVVENGPRVYVECAYHASKPALLEPSEAVRAIGEASMQPPVPVIHPLSFHDAIGRNERPEFARFRECTNKSCGWGILIPPLENGEVHLSHYSAVVCPKCGNTNVVSND